MLFGDAREPRIWRPEPEMGRVPHLLIVDDDPLFLASVRRAASHRNIEVTLCGSWRELNRMANPDLFDVAVVDYYLDRIRENLLGSEVAGVMEGTPVILISASDHGAAGAETWPESVRRFLNKSVGVEAILDTALETGRGRPERIL